VDNNPWVRRLFSPLTNLPVSGPPVEYPITVVIPARDEERCIGRCLDSVTGRDFDDIVVVDTGSVDKTTRIAAGYDGVRLVEFPWTGSFAEVRNFAIDFVHSGWIVFLDADEWIDDRSAGRLRSCLTSLSGLQALDRLVFAPRIQNVGRDDVIDGVARVFKADSGIHYRGAVHEYPVGAGPVDEPVNMVGVDIVFHHDGYDPSLGKDKRHRNLDLLRAAQKTDPDNPRWLHFLVRDGFPVLDKAEISDLCASLRKLAGRNPVTGDRLSAQYYYRRTLCLAGQGFAAMGDWATVYSYCDELDRVAHNNNPDAHYLRSVAELVNGIVTGRDLLHTMKLRRDEDLVSTSVLDVTGRHLDALLVAQLAQVKGAGAADRYHELCAPWTDTFFERSRLRQYR
jgi:glycosyltransferase involved in cell wall biosynthesis